MLGRAAHLMIGSAAAAVDRAATLAAKAQFRGRRLKNKSESLGHEERLRLLGELKALYPPEVCAAYFREPRAIIPAERTLKSKGESRVVDVSWASDYEPLLSDVAPRYTRHIENHVAAARLFVSGRPRPIAILVHGYMAGQFAIEQHVWPVELLNSLGFDVALFVLPFHGVRSVATRNVPPFPGSDPRISNEGFRQAIGDLRDFIRWLRERGHREVGVAGMSLGGYTAALAATVESDLAFSIPIIPLASLADWARDQGRLGQHPEQTALQHRALEAVHEVVSPLHRPPLIAPERVLVIAAKADRITPIQHAMRLSRHFNARLQTMPGGHLLQIGRAESFRQLGHFLVELGLGQRPR
ncbi:MAG TPA: YqiA/YcfP family alpha/beta fold hydrolase [Polyangiaceae bacterium]|nr:YqiA/YcfP family alpha/beta fold hydrolase [Polyangiaceae bacterium]